MYLKQLCLIGLVFVTFWYFPGECVPFTSDSESSDTSESYSIEGKK